MGFGGSEYQNNLVNWQEGWDFALETVAQQAEQMALNVYRDTSVKFFRDYTLEKLLSLREEGGLDPRAKDLLALADWARSQKHFKE